MFHEMNSSVNIESEDESTGIMDNSRRHLIFSDSIPQVFVSDSKDTLLSRNGIKFGNS
jgi:hypothetical protein